MFGFGKKKGGITVHAPVAGSIAELSTVSDEVFSSGMMGPGFAVTPTESTITAPVAGKLVTVFKTGHAFAIKTAEGLEVLVHIGLDTVEMKGRGFEILKHSGETVAAGDPVVTVDLDAVRTAGYDPVTLVIFTNKKDIASVELADDHATVTLNS